MSQSLYSYWPDPQEIANIEAPEEVLQEAAMLFTSSYGPDLVAWTGQELIGDKTLAFLDLGSPLLNERYRACTIVHPTFLYPARLFGRTPSAFQIQLDHLPLESDVPENTVYTADELRQALGRTLQREEVKSAIGGLRALARFASLSS